MPTICVSAKNIAIWAYGFMAKTRLFFLLQVLERLLEGIYVRKRAVDGCEADVGNLVHFPEPLNHERAYLFGFYLLAVFLPEPCFHPVRDCLYLLPADRALLARLGNPVQQLVPVELLPSSALFYHEQVVFLDFLVGGEPAPALVALPSPAYAEVVRVARIDHVAFRVRAVGASHASHRDGYNKNPCPAHIAVSGSSSTAT